MLKLICKTIEGAKEQFAHYGEIVFDLAVDNEAWENVPLVDHALKLLQIRDIYGKNKLKSNYQAFVAAIREMDESEATLCLEALRANGSLGKEVADTIFDIIIRAEKPIKATLLGNLLVAVSQQSITLQEYDTLALIILTSSIPALKAVPDFLSENSNMVHRNSAGGIKQEALLISLGVATRHGNNFRLDENGVGLAVHGFGIVPSNEV